MSNIISNNRYNNNDYLKMSNGATDVLIDILVLSGSSLAQTNWQKGLVIFFASKNQEIKGQGCISFDISDLGWEMDHFEEQKKFLLKVIECAIKETNWNKLNYQPSGDYVSNLRRLREMIINYSKVLVEPTDILKWNKEFNKIEFRMCVKHNVYMHPIGCKLCYTQLNDIK